MNNQAKGPGGDRGAVLVELAIIVPVLFLILFGLVEVGRGLYQDHILTKAVASGGRFLAREPELLTIDEDAETCSPREPIWSETTAEASNLVVYGSTDPNGGSEPLLPNMDVDNVTASVRWTEVNSTEDSSGFPCVIRVEATAAFDPVIAPEAFLGLGALELGASVEERYIGE